MGQEFIEHVDDNELPTPFIQLNKVRRQEIYQYYGGDSTFISATNYRYDPNGNLKEIEQFNKMKVSMSKKLFIYNSFNKIEKQISYYGSDKKPISEEEKLTDEFQYDSLGRHNYTIHYNKDTTTLRILQKVYDADNRVIKAFLTINNKKPVQHAVIQYDKIINTIKLDTYDDQGRQLLSYLTTYDADKNSRTVYVILRGNKRFAERVNYNSAGLVQARYSYPAGYLVDNANQTNPNKVEKFFYNTDGTLNSSIVYINGEVSSSYKYFYTK